MMSQTTALQEAKRNQSPRKTLRTCIITIFKLLLLEIVSFPLEASIFVRVQFYLSDITCFGTGCWASAGYEI